MKTKILLFITLVRIFNTMAQTTDKELENKYYNYRDRFKKYFTQIGKEAGQSQVAAQINYETQSSDSFKIINGVLTKVSPRGFNGAQHYGDAIVDHGYYLAVLASEYKLMCLQNRKNTPEFTALCNEIYFAINAIDRLDENAERYLGRFASGSKNGFFIRSDHDEKFISCLNNTEGLYGVVQKFDMGNKPRVLTIVNYKKPFRLFYNNKWYNNPYQPIGVTKGLGNIGDYRV